MVDVKNRMSGSLYREPQMQRGGEARPAKPCYFAIQYGHVVRWGNGKTTDVREAARSAFGLSDENMLAWNLGPRIEEARKMMKTIKWPDQRLKEGNDIAKMSPLGRLCILAAMLSVSNMGHPLPAAKDIMPLLKNDSISLDGAVLRFAEQYMETDEHERGFKQEARGFLKDLADEKKSRQRWPDVFKRYEEAVMLLVPA